MFRTATTEYDQTHSVEVSSPASPASMADRLNSEDSSGRG